MIIILIHKHYSIIKIQYIFNVDITQCNIEMQSCTSGSRVFAGVRECSRAIASVRERARKAGDRRAPRGRAFDRQPLTSLTVLYFANYF